MKCIVFIGTRPEFIKMQPVVKVLRRLLQKDQLQVVFSGQHKDLITIADPASHLYADDYLNFKSANAGLSIDFAALQTEVSNYLLHQPATGFVLVQGDTSTAAAAALASRLCGWKVMHIEAGLRTYQEEPFPEEIFRRIISSVASFHFAPTSLNAQSLRNEGIPEDRIMVCGNSGIDHLMAWLKRSDKRRKPKMDAQIRVLATLHRGENKKEGVPTFAKLLERVATCRPAVVIDWIMHPSIQQEMQRISFSKDISLIEPLAFDALADKLLETDLLITDSGGLQEEAVALGVPMVVYRNYSERQEAILQGYPAIVSTDHDQIIDALGALLNVADVSEFRTVYGDGYAAHDIAAKIISVMNITPEYGTVIVGGGPGGTGPLLSAVRLNKMGEFSKEGLAVIEKGNVLVRGQLTSYKVNSDTLANVFFECLDGDENPLGRISQLTEYRELFSSYINRHIPLDALKDYLEVLGYHLEQIITAIEGNHVYFHTEVTSLSKLTDGRWLLHALCNGTPMDIIAAKVILAPGGRPERLTNDQLFSDVHLNTWRRPAECMEVLYSDDVLRGRENARLSSILKAHEHTDVVVLGASHSGFSVAWYLQTNFQDFGGNITIAGFGEPAVFYPSAEEAKRDGYHLFDENDICPVTGRVFRLGGLRGDGRDLYRSIKGLGSEKFSGNITYRNLLVESEGTVVSPPARPYIIIVAYGYKLNIPEVFDESDNSIKFKGRRDGHWVNEKAVLLDDNGNEVTNLYAIGLATGFLPSGDLGGESSFTKQTNGLWYYQHLLGEMLVKEIIS